MNLNNTRDKVSEDEHENKPHPDEPLNIYRLEQYAKKKAHPAVWRYINWNADHDRTYKLTRKQYSKILLKPSILTPVTHASTETILLGNKSSPISLPLLIAPTAFHGLAHPEGEAASAAAAANTGIGYCLNFKLSGSTLDEIRTAAPTGLKWLHLYLTRNRVLLEKILDYCEASNLFSAVIVTCDHPHDRVKNRTNPDVGKYRDEIPFYNSGQLQRNWHEFIRLYNLTIEQNEPQSEFTWDYIEHIAKYTKLPVIAKGVLTPEDAKKAVAAGCKGVVVSNHGGRQVGSVVPSIVALPGVVEAVGGRNGAVEVYLDSGIRESGDLVKALALGAKAVMIGRPAMWGLMADGRKGVEKMVEGLKYNLKADLQSLGKTSVKELDESVIWSLPKLMTEDCKL